MKAIWIIGKREIAAYFTSPVAYVFLVIFLLLTGFFTFTAGSFFERGEASLAAFLGVALALTFPAVVTVNLLGDPDNGIIFAGYLGSFLLAGAYLAISCMTSAMTRNQVVAFILSVVLCLFLILAGFNPVTDLMVRWASPAMVDTVAAFSVVTHYDGFQRGVIDTRDLFYFLSVIGFALFATGVILRGHRAG
jgi:ABC-2 type transport system permease protein